jgi:hypothetical protein
MVKYLYKILYEDFLVIPLYHLAMGEGDFLFLETINKFKSKIFAQHFSRPSNPVRAFFDGERFGNLKGANFRLAITVLKQHIAVVAQLR